MLLTPSTLLFFSGLATAHTTLQFAAVDGTENNDIIRPVPNNNPIQDVTSQDMACNVDGNNPAGATAEIAAGGTLMLEWHHEGRETQAIAESHKGPVMTYMAAVDSASSASSPQSLDWFKIDESGLNGDTWAVDELNANNGKWESTIPSVPDGEYLVRQEIIALHSAGSQGGAQFYIGCAQIKVTGGGGSGCSETVQFPGAYTADDPGILVSIYDNSGSPVPESYEIPGPAVC